MLKMTLRVGEYLLMIKFKYHFCQSVLNNLSKEELVTLRAPLFFIQQWLEEIGHIGPQVGVLEKTHDEHGLVTSYFCIQNHANLL